MFGDRERPARISAEQDRALARYLREEVYPYTELHRRRLDEAGLQRGALRTRGDLASLPTTTLESLTDTTPLLLRPDATHIRRYGDWKMRTRLRLATVLGRQSRLARGRIDPQFKPVHWALAEGLLVASSAADLDRLGELGRRWLESAGVRPHDVLVSLVSPGPDIGFWQLVLGARRAGLSALYLEVAPTPAQAEYLRPTVLAGPADALLSLARGSLEEGRSLGSVHTVLVVGGDYDPEDHRRLRGLLPAAAVSAAWAPPGVRALWAQCRNGRGLHTWPATEIIELVEPSSGRPAAPRAVGEVVWSSLGWRGTVFLRLRTGVLATLDTTLCPDCGRTTPRIEPLAFPAVLDRAGELTGWQAELRDVGGTEELIVYAALAPGLDGDAAEALRRLDEQVLVTQFVILEQAELDARLAQHGGARVLDRRAGAAAAS